MTRRPGRAPFHRFTDNPAMTSEPLPWRIHPSPDPVDAELEPLLDEPFASAWAMAGGPVAGPVPLRARLLERLAASRTASEVMVTSRMRRLAPTALAPGVTARTLYAAPRERLLRPGEPLRARLVEWQAGGRWEGPDVACHREWLVLRGAVDVDGQHLGPRDYHAVPAGTASGGVVSTHGALVFVRESSLDAAPGELACTVRDAEAGWPEFAPGIRRRVLWQRDGQAALLYHARPGAAVPAHSHGHDEECLMVQGELFLDDLLLQEGDYQLAPAGTGHRITATDTGVVIYAHGDLDLRFET